MTRNVILSIVLVVAAGVSLVWANMRFDHRAHVEDYGLDCVSCHLPGAQSIVPATAVCLDCHDKELLDGTTMGAIKTHGPVWALNHRSEAKSGAMDCSACHQQSFCLDCHKAGFADEQGAFGNNMINVHTSDFHVSHPIAARTNPQLCSSCHEPSFCSDCHSTFNRADLAFDSHRRSFSGISVGNGIAHEQFDHTQCQDCHAGSVLPSHQWSANHAREARKNLATCQACHPQGDVCMQCHSARSGLRVSPHPSNWGSIKNRLDAAGGGRTCRMCH